METVCYTVVVGAFNASSSSTSSFGSGNLQVNLLDTGTTAVLSTERSDFVGGDEFVKKVRIVGVGAEKVGYKRKMRKNKFGFSHGIFVFEIAAGIKRLIPVPPGHILQDYETGVSGYIRNRTSGEIFSIKNSVPPEVDFVFLKDPEVDFPVHCFPVLQKSASSKPVAVPKRIVHRRLCHLPPLGGKCKCLACELSMKVRKRFAKKRKEKYRQKKPLAQLDGDFVGPISPESVRRYRFGLLIVCAKTKRFWGLPIRHKNENTDRLRTLLFEIRAGYATRLGDPVLYYFRSDNEVVWDGRFADLLKENNVQPLRPSPYSPAANGLIERYVRKIVVALRAMLLYCDAKLWCYALEHYSMVHNDIHENPNGLSPMEECEQLLVEAEDPRRRLTDATTGRPLVTRHESTESIVSKYSTFGSLCVCHIEDPIAARAAKFGGEPTGKFATPWLPGVYLGKDKKSSNPMVGLWIGDEWTVRRERNVYEGD